MRSVSLYGDVLTTPVRLAVNYRDMNYLPSRLADGWPRQNMLKKVSVFYHCQIFSMVQNVTFIKWWFFSKCDMVVVVLCILLVRPCRLAPPPPPLAHPAEEKNPHPLFPGFYSHPRAWRGWVVEQLTGDRSELQSRSTPAPSSPSINFHLW